MKKLAMICVALTMAASAAQLTAQPAAVSANGVIGMQGPASGTAAPAQVFDKQLSGFEKEFVSLAEAMPADKYNFAPTNGEFKGVRDFGSQAKHVAQANAAYAAAIMGKKPDPNFLKDAKTKDEIVAGLKKSFEEAHAAVATVTPQNAFEEVPPPFGKNPVTRAGLAAQIVQHGFDHYGQMVEYLRMNGQVPPASQR